MSRAMKVSFATHLGERPVVVPRHLAVVMDGNGRWAARRGLPRRAGHQAGHRAVRELVQEATQRGIEHLTVFAFSSENWQRPPQEVAALMALFLRALRREIEQLRDAGVRVDFIGARELLAANLRVAMGEAEAATRTNERLRLHVAVSYGGRWDLLSAARRLATEAARGQLQPDAVDERTLRSAMALPGVPDPDLFIRTGGECRISNFLLWNLAYTELYFTDTLWPDFDAAALDAALATFAQRQRRYGQVAAVASHA